MSEELKPCAHCGNTDIKINAIPYFKEHEAVKVMCWECGIATQYMPSKKAIERWNQRT